MSGAKSRSNEFTLSRFPLGKFGGEHMKTYQAHSGRLHLHRECTTLARSAELQEGLITLPLGGTLADIPAQVHCLPPGELRNYLALARELCEAAKKLRTIASRLRISLPESERSAAKARSYANEYEIDWPAIGEAYRVRNLLRLEGMAGAERPSEYVKELAKDAVAFPRRISELLYETSLAQARSNAGRDALSRMLAARCVLLGKERWGYTPIYKDFMSDIRTAMTSVLYRRNDYSEEIAAFLADRSGFDFGHRWLDAVEVTGDPTKATTTVQEEMKTRQSLKDEPVMSGALLASAAAGAAATSYLDGVCHGQKGSSLVLVDSYTSPFRGMYSLDMDALQWEVFPSATCQLHANSRRKAALTARVACVPKLWIEALHHPGGILPREGLVILHQDDEGLIFVDAETCTTIANSIAQSCHAEVLSELSRWHPTITASERRRAIKKAQLVIRAKG